MLYDTIKTNLVNQAYYNIYSMIDEKTYRRVLVMLHEPIFTVIDVPVKGLIKVHLLVRSS